MIDSALKKYVPSANFKLYSMSIGHLEHNKKVKWFLLSDFFSCKKTIFCHFFIVYIYAL